MTGHNRKRCVDDLGAGGHASWTNRCAGWGSRDTVDQGGHIIIIPCVLNISKWQKYTCVYNTRCTRPGPRLDMECCVVMALWPCVPVLQLNRIRNHK